MAFAFIILYEICWPKFSKNLPELEGIASMVLPMFFAFIFC